MSKIATAISSRLTDGKKLEALIDIGIAAVLIITVLLTMMLFSFTRLSGAQSVLGLAQAVTQTTTAQTAPGDLTLVLSLAGVMGTALLSAYYFMAHRSG